MNNKNKYGYYFECNNVENNNKIIYLTRNGFKLYFKEKHNINIYKQPDEAFILTSIIISFSFLLILRNVSYD